MRTLFFTAMLSGCNLLENPQRHLRLCLGGTDLESIQRSDREGLTAYTVTGRYLGPDPSFSLGSCSASAESISIQQADGTTLNLGWEITNNEGEPMRFPSIVPELQPNQSVRITFVREMGWGEDSAVVVDDDDGIVFAAEEGYITSLARYDDTLTHGLQVERASSSSGLLRFDDCGRQAKYSEVFSVAGDRTEVLFGQTQTLQPSGLRAHNVGAWSYEGDLRCTDTWGPTPWVVWRQAIQ